MKGKLASRRFWVACWAAALCTYIVVRDAATWSGVATVLIGVVGGWLTSETITKKRSQGE